MGSIVSTRVRYVLFSSHPRSAVLVCLSGGIVLFRREHIHPTFPVICLLLLLGCIATFWQTVRLSGRTVSLDDEGIAIANKQGQTIESTLWTELASVTERRKMAQLALWDRSGVRRVLVDQQFEKFNLIRSRILAEYAESFTLKPFPIKFCTSFTLRYETIVFALCAAGCVWASKYNIIFAFFAVFFLINVLSLYPQLRGPSILFEDRLVLRSLFRTREIRKQDVDRIELRDVPNPRSGQRFSFVTVVVKQEKPLKITHLYGSIPKIFLTLQAWLAANSNSPAASS